MDEKHKPSEKVDKNDYYRLPLSPLLVTSFLSPSSLPSSLLFYISLSKVSQEVAAVWMTWGLFKVMLIKVTFCAGAVRQGDSQGPTQEDRNGT